VYTYIEQVHECDSTFTTNINKLYINLDGIEITPEQGVGGCNTIAENKAFQTLPDHLVQFSNSDNKFYGVKDEYGRVILPAVYKSVTINQFLGWISVNRDSLYGICKSDGTWLFPLEERGLSMTGNDSICTIWIHDQEQTLMLNQRMELLNEDPVIFQTPDYYEWDAVPDSLRPDVKKLFKVLYYTPFNIYNDGKNGYVFNSNGKYISTHSGSGDAFYGPGRIYFDKNKYGEQYVPIGEFIELKKGIQPYYVRLTDGFEYRRK
jgi:hypothetical protein